LPKIIFEGTVFSGSGEGKKFIDLPWVKRQIQEKANFIPYPGTLNIRLRKENIKRKKTLEAAKHTEVCPEEGYCTGLLIKAQIDSTGCAVILPQTPDYPSDVLEVIASCYLRGNLSLHDGSVVKVTVNV